MSISRCWRVQSPRFRLSHSLSNTATSSDTRTERPDDLQSLSQRLQDTQAKVQELQKGMDDWINRWLYDDRPNDADLFIPDYTDTVREHLLAQMEQNRLELKRLEYDPDAARTRECKCTSSAPTSCGVVVPSRCPCSQQRVSRCEQCSDAAHLVIFIPCTATACTGSNHPHLSGRPRRSRHGRIMGP